MVHRIHLSLLIAFSLKDNQSFQLPKFIIKTSFFLFLLKKKKDESDAQWSIRLPLKYIERNLGLTSTNHIKENRRVSFHSLGQHFF